MASKKFTLPDKYSEGVVHLTEGQIKERLLQIVQKKQQKRQRFLEVMSKYVEIKWA